MGSDLVLIDSTLGVNRLRSGVNRLRSDVNSLRSGVNCLKSGCKSVFCVNWLTNQSKLP